MNRLLAGGVALVLALLVSEARAQSAQGGGDWWRDGWSVTGFLGRVSTDKTSDIAIGNFGFEDAGTAGIGIGKHLLTLTDNLSLEGEGQFVRHFGDQRHWETNGIMLLRWRGTPWDHWLPTSFAVGSGLSLPSETPALELARRPEDSTRLLHYLYGEIAVALPDGGDRPDWEMVLRYHHRSGAFGTFGGVSEASTVFALGLRRNF